MLFLNPKNHLRINKEYTVRNLLIIPLLLFTLSSVSYANATISHVQFREYSQDMERKTKAEVAYEIQRIKNLLEYKTANGAISRPVALVLATTLSTLTYLLVTGSITHYFTHHNDNGLPNDESQSKQSSNSSLAWDNPNLTKPVDPPLSNKPDTEDNSAISDHTTSDQLDTSTSTAARILHYRHILAGIMALSLPSSAAVGIALGMGSDDVKVPIKDILMMSTTRTMSSFAAWGSSSLASWFFFEKLQGAVNYRMRGTYMGAISLALLPYQIYGLYSDLVTKRNELKNEVLDLQDMLDTAKAAYYKFELEEDSTPFNQPEMHIDQRKSF